MQVRVPQIAAKFDLRYNADALAISLNEKTESIEEANALR